MAAAEGLPIDLGPGLDKFIAQPFRHDIGQDRIFRAMALKDRQAFSFGQQRPPFLFGHQRPRELDQSRIGLCAVQQRIASQHGSL